MATYENMELLGMQIDSIDNLLSALKLPLPPATHIAGLTQNLEKIVKNLRQVYIAETGDNPWE